MKIWQRIQRVLARPVPFEGLTIHGPQDGAFSIHSPAYIVDHNVPVAVAERMTCSGAEDNRVVSVDHFAVDSNHIGRRVGRLAFLELVSVLMKEIPGLNVIVLHMYRYPEGHYRRSHLTGGRLRFLHAFGVSVSKRRKGPGSYGERALAVSLNVAKLGLPASLDDERRMYVEKVRDDVLKKRPVKSS